MRCCFPLLALVFAIILGGCSGAPRGGEPEARALEAVRVAGDGRSFVLEPSGQPFVPWGFNYDHDEDDRLIEDYWHAEWPKVVEDFREMKALGANVVRIHLQLGRFLDGPERVREEELERYARLLALSEEIGIYLDVTGLGCYHRRNVPEWYDALPEAERWEAQARFWRAIAARSRACPAVFCYDLMNEPVVPGGDGKRSDWLGPAFAGKHFVQFIALERRGREPEGIARAWTEKLAAAIRAEDPRRLITVGLVPWSLRRPGLYSGFDPAETAGALDFVSVHIYPEAGRMDEALETLAGFQVGKPLVIEETFPLRCGLEDFERFLDGSRASAAGWLGFYWGRTPEECRRSGEMRDALMLQWLELFERRSGREEPASDSAPRARS
jgi:hypothetical protein